MTTNKTANDDLLQPSDLETETKREPSDSDGFTDKEMKELFGEPLDPNEPLLPIKQKKQKKPGFLRMYFDCLFEVIAQ